MMQRPIRWLILAGLCAQAFGSELNIDFSQHSLDEQPPGFRSLLGGKGHPGTWKVIRDDAAADAPGTSGKKVLAQLSGDITDERFPLLIYDKETFGDFTLTTRLKNVGGAFEQMAGIAFRFQDVDNYYYVRASSLGNTFRFFKIVHGQRSAAIGPEMEIPRGVWHELTIECKGHQIRCLLNGKEVIPSMTDTTFKSGKIGFFTKSDSIAYFDRTTIRYTPHLTLASHLVEEMLRLYPRLLGLKIFATPEGKSGEAAIIASTDQQDIGHPSDDAVKDVLARDAIYYGKSGQSVSVTLPLHDRNGETVAAVRISMKSFRGQTEQNAIARAMPVVRRMEARLRAARSLFE